MTGLPLVSIIIPTYNRAQNVCSAVDSVLAQTYSPVEIIVVDDGSADDTLARLKRYGDRIQLIRQRNGGPSAARHAGVEVSHGDLLAFLDSDDVWLPGFLERCASALQKAGDSVPCCISNALLKRVKGRHNTSFDNATLFPKLPEGLWWNVTDVLVARFVQTCQTTLIRRHAYERAGGFDPRLRYDEDHDLALRLSLLGPWAFIAEPLVVWQQSVDSISRGVLIDDKPLKECELRVWRRFEKLAEPHGEKLLKRVRREAANIQATLDSRNKDVRTRPLGLGVFRKPFRIAGRAAGAVYRRSPWYPKMKTSPLSGPGRSLPSTGDAF